MPRVDARRAGWRRWALRLGLSAASVLLVGAAFEGVLRLGWIPNPEYNRRHAPRPATAGPDRILILGDSFIIPLGLTGRLVAEGLARRGVGVRNAATSGTGPFEYLDELKRAIAAFQPEIVLLSYYAGNDLTDVQNHPRFDDGGRPGRRTGVAINRSSSRPLLRRLYAYHYLRATFNRLRARSFDAAELARAGIAPELIEDAKHLRLNPYLLRLALFDRNHFLDNVLLESDDAMRAWSKVRELLSEIHDICQRRGIELRVVMFPHSIQVNDSQFEFFRKLTFNMDRRTLTSSRPQELMREFCAERSIPLLDLLPEFRQRSDEDLFLELDDHLNAAGHRLAARRILEFLEAPARAPQ